VPDEKTLWIARLTPAQAVNLNAVLDLSLGLDVWERRPDSLVVAATDLQLSEIERRRLARVEKLCTLAEFRSRANHNPEEGP